MSLHKANIPKVAEKDSPVKVDTDYAQHASNLFNEAAPPADTAPFGLTVDQLTVLQDHRDPYLLQAVGGIAGLEHKLSTSTTRGLSTAASANPVHASLDARKEYYGSNKLPERKSKSFFQLILVALQDKVLILLCIVAAISLAIGLYETFGQPTEYDEEGNSKPKVGWVEGVAVIVAIAIVSIVGAGNDWQKERQFVKLNRKKEDHHVTVIRDGITQNISVFDVQVGDLVTLEPGDILCTDGILTSGYGIKADEAALTGESANVRKTPAADVFANLHGQAPTTKGLDSFMISGSKILEGTGSYIVTSVGSNSFHGKMLLSMQTDPEETPLQEKLNAIAESIAKMGSLAALLMFIVLFIRFLAQLPNSPLTAAQKGQEFLTILITAITIVVVAVPEGLPLAVTLALAFATIRMVKDNNLVRVLKACETMGGATAICSDKTGTLTQNRMTIVAGSFTSEFQVDPDSKSDKKVQSAEQFASNLSSKCKDLTIQSIAANSSAFEEAVSDSGETFVGSKTETALLNFARTYLGLGPLAAQRETYKVLRVYPFDSAKKFMATVIARPEGGVRVLVKGAAEVMVGLCASIFDESCGTAPITSDQVEMFQDRIATYAAQSLRTIGLIYRDFPDMADWNPPKHREHAMFTNMTLLGIVGIQDPLRPGVKKAVLDCQNAGVIVRMVTGDNVGTARAIAKDCGILQNNEKEVVMEGPEFRKMSETDMKKMLPSLRVLARSSPDDKKLLVRTLRDMGDTVAVTGDGTNDAPALKMADVGFSMGIAGTEVAKEASDIIIMDDNFSSIVKAIIWGRTVNDAVKKFLQFQLTVNITAVILTFVSAIAASNNESVLTAVQLLWVNLIMDTFAALALATDPPSESVLDRKPDNRKASLFSPTMWKIILGEAVYQLIVSFILHFGGPHFFSADTPEQRQQLHALVFNTFVWMQYFKMFVARRLDNKLNMFEGIWKNWYYVGVSGVILGAQVLIMFVGGAAFSIERQTGSQWAIAILCGFGSIPVGILLRLIPDEVVVRYFPTRAYKFVVRMAGKLQFWHYWTKKSPEIRVDGGEGGEGDEEAKVGYKWPQPFEQVKADLVLLKLRGGRWTQIKTKPRRMYQSLRNSISASSSNASLQSAASPVSTLYVSSPASSPSSPALTPQTPQTPQGLRPTTDEAGFLAVPGPSSPGRMRFNRSRGSSTSSRSSYSIEALTMVPTLVGGAIAGWAPEASTERPVSRAT